MKMLFISDVHENPDSGAAGTEYQTIKALRNLGHEVDAVWSSGLPHKISHGNLHFLLEQPRAYRQVVESHLAQCDYDVIHVNQSAAYHAASYYQKLGCKGVFVCRSHGVELRANECLKAWSGKLGIQQRGFPKSLPGYLIDSGISRACRLAAKYSDGYIVSCTEDRDFLINRFDVSGERVACIAQAVPDTYLKSPKPMTEYRMQKLLMVGPPKLWKGVHILADAWSQLSRGNPCLSLTWVCSENEWGEAKALLPRQALESVSFVNLVSQQALIELYDSHGIFLFPSLFEGFGKAPLEAMSRALCVIASDTGGMRDVINTRVDGVLFEAGNANQLVAAIKEVCSNYDVACAMSDAARETALQYSWGRVADETVMFYEKLINLKQRNLNRSVHS